MHKVFIDGGAGTTGLRLRERLTQRKDIALIELSDEMRKDANARRDALNEAEIAFLCLPDDAARESVSLIENPLVRVIDTSTAHRVAQGWAYGLAELTGQRERIASSLRVANPGCHASGFIALIAPLVEAGLIKKDEHLSCFSLTGYSGGGKKMIAQYESESRDLLLNAPRQYGLSQAHKHLPEMTYYSGLDAAPAFCPVVAPFYSGMEVAVLVFGVQPERAKEVYRQKYAGGLIRFKEESDEQGFLSAAAYSGKDDMEISVHGNDERLLLVARFDNLGKGASGAAIQNMNIMLGLNESTGLAL